MVAQDSSRDTTGASTQDLEFGGVGLFGARGGAPEKEMEGLRNHRQEEEVPAPTIRTMQSMRTGGDIYDMAAYVAKSEGEGRPRRPYRGRQRVRPGLEGFRRMDEGVLEQEREVERPVIPLNNPGLATIDRRPGRPMFHHQGPGPLAMGPQGPVTLQDSLVAPGPQLPLGPALPNPTAQGLGRQGLRQPGFRRRLRPPQVTG